MLVKKEDHIVSGEELLDLLRSQAWESIIPRLHYYSLNKLLRFQQLENRYNVKDLATYFADEAIKQLWTEERRWNMDYYPDIFSFLKGAVDSIRSNFIRSKEVKETDPLPENDEFELVSANGSPEAVLMQQELEQQLKSIFVQDPEAFEVFDCLRNEMKPRDIAKDMNVPVKKVYNAIKRIERILAPVKTDLTN